ncbi:hypothetical protein SFC79_13375 [Nocardioides sp. S-58]|uniref:DUF4245 domain-containing protein n=1 Tax=Nocardioides renjunii TaxID=3095075 RepID=A0ABU5KCT2_9ACTN|nr:hypothetical protein [Nocardioides sp. S-58]MDZ5662759.1 hypothetical protein [Nocardioides sp. S-58]
MRLHRAIGPALGVSLVLLAGACGDDTGSSADDPAASETPSASESPAPVEPVDFGDEPALEPRYKKAALRAVDDDLITMVPTVLPEGWETTGGGYTPDPQWWRMEFTAPTGEVVLDQMPGKAADVLAEAGLTAGDDVDLSDWGTGPWSSWDHDGASVLAYDLKGSTVVLQGPDQETVRGLAESLLPAEDAGEQEG